MIRLASLRHALNDLRAVHARAQRDGSAKADGSHLPARLELADGTTLTLAVTPPKPGQFHHPDLPHEPLGYFDYVRRDAKNRIMSHNRP